MIQKPVFVPIIGLRAYLSLSRPPGLAMVDGELVNCSLVGYNVKPKRVC